MVVFFFFVDVLIMLFGLPTGRGWGLLRDGHNIRTTFCHDWKEYYRINCLFELALYLHKLI